MTNDPATLRVSLPGEYSVPPVANGSRRRPTPAPPEYPRMGDEAAPTVRVYLRLCRILDLAVALGVLLAAFLVTNIGRMPHGFAEFLGLRLTVRNLLLLMGFAVAWRLVCRACELYEWSRSESSQAESRRVLLAAMLGGVAALVFPLFSESGAFQVRTVLLSLLGIGLGMLVLRRALRGLLDIRPREVRTVLIVGSGMRAMRLADELARNDPDTRVIGFVDAGAAPHAAEIGTRYLGDLGHLEQILLAHPVSEVYVALPVRSRYEESHRAIAACEDAGVRVHYLADVFEGTHGRRSWEDGERGGVISMSGAPNDHRVVLKRVADVCGAVISLVLAAPILLVAAAAIKLTSPGPVIFAQERYGLNRHRFRMYKLRTMVTNAESLMPELEELNEALGPLFKIRNDPRFTPIGGFLRRTSIDELPQLVNVLRGEMSLVGPRPLSLRDAHRFTESTLVRRFSVRPGITGLWQVNGRSELSFERWAELDLRYVDEWSLALDFRILLMTLPAVVKGTGAA
jgi:exopolysaccharide biosynthesis polyprenyl glycosylphosphotransferase